MTSRSPAVASKPLFESVSTAEISVSADRIDVSDWLFDLTSGEYQFCSPDHIACGSSLAPDGRRMSINVESMGGDVLIQHYIEEVADPHHCRVRSESDLLQALGQSTIEIIWDLSIQSQGAERSILVNRISAHATPRLLDLWAEHKIPVEAAAGRMRELADAHNATETPAFAKNIEDKAAGRRPGYVSSPAIEQESVVLAETRCSAPIAAPIEAVNLAHWLFNLSEADYQACSVAHLAAGVSKSLDGKRISINAEKLNSLIVQQYQEVIVEPHHCRVISPRSKVIASAGASTLHVVWDLSVTATDASHCELHNLVILKATPEFDAAIASAGAPLELVRQQLLNAVTAHNRDETPKFATDMARKAVGEARN